MNGKSPENDGRPSFVFSSTKVDMSTPVPVPIPERKLVALSPADLAFVRHAIGASFDEETNELVNSTTPLLRPTSTGYPPRGLPNGLYRDVVRSRILSQYQYYFCSVYYNVSLVMQLLLGAAMTALSSSSSTPKRATAVTLLAATNTVNAGILALMHNSGIPDRFKNDWTEFDKVGMFLEELITAGIAPEGESKEDLVQECWDRYAKARATVARNKPDVYTPSAGGTAGANGTAKGAIVR